MKEENRTVERPGGLEEQGGLMVRIIFVGFSLTRSRGHEKLMAEPYLLILL